MAEFSMKRIAWRGFGGLLHARGRDDRMQFWIYCALVFGPLIVVQFVTQIVLTFPSLDLIVAAKPGDVQAGQRIFEAQMRGMVTSAYVNVAIYLLGALLLLTAAGRRLHDRGRAGWWALILPFGVFATGLAQAHRMVEVSKTMPALLAEMQGTQGSEQADMINWISQANKQQGGPDWLAVVGGLVLLWLVVDLLRAGTEGANRFGPAPE